MQRLYDILDKYMRTAWRRRWLALIAAWAVCALGWAFVAQMPNQFESTARIYVEADAFLTPLLRGLAADVNTSNQLEVIQRTLLSQPNMDKLIRMTDLETRVTDEKSREKLIQDLSVQIKLKPQTKNLFSIAYRDPNRQLARDVVQALLTIFVESNTGTSRSGMENAQRFLRDQINTYLNQLREAEKRRADFRSKYSELLPGEGNAGSRLESARVMAGQLRAELNDAVSRRDAMQTQLQNTPATVAASAATGGNNRLLEAQNELTQLRLRLTDKHPDVVAARRRLEAMKSGNGSDGPLTTANVLYEQIKLKIVESEAQIAAYKGRLSEAEKDLTRLEEISKQAPGVAAEYQNLDRDYNIIRKNYEELLARREATRLAEAADAKADQIQIRVVDPPQASVLPVAPKRALLYAGVFFSGIGMAAAVIFLFVQIDRSFGSVLALETREYPVIGSISLIKEPVIGRKFELRPLAMFGGGAGALVFLFLLLVALTNGTRSSAGL